MDTEFEPQPQPRMDWRGGGRRGDKPVAVMAPKRPEARPQPVEKRRFHWFRWLVLIGTAAAVYWYFFR